MTLLPEVERALLDAVRRDHRRRRASRWSRLRAAPLRAPLVALALVLGTTTIALAASGVILTGSPVSTRGHQKPTVGFGVPTPGGSRLLPLRAADPAGGLPWGMRIIHTTRGYLCVQIGRVDHGQLGELGIDGAFHDDGRFHPLPASALPEDVSMTQRFDIDCEEGHSTFAGDIVGMEPSAASNPAAGTGSRSARREISYGLLGPNAVKITYRAGSRTLTRRVLPGLGAYLIVRRATSGRRLGSISDTDGGTDRPTNPNGALTAITYRYGKRRCTDTGHGRTLHACGLYEGPPPKPAPLPAVHEPLRVHLRIHHHIVTAAEIVFHAPYAVTSAAQSYGVGAYSCYGTYTGASALHDVAKGARVSVSVGSILSYACAHSVKFTVDYFRNLNGIPANTSLGTVTVRIPPGDHATPLPRRVKERLRRNEHRTAHH